MVRVSSSKKKKDVENGGEKLNPEAIERRRLKTLAFSNNIISETPAKPRQPLTPSKLVIKNHGKDIVKKSQRKNRFLFSFPGLIAPIGGGKIGDLKDLGTKNPVLYLDFPQGRMKLFGTIVYPKNRYLTLQFPRGGKSVMCEDYFDNMIVFSDAWWIGKQADNPEEARLDFPKELSDVQQTEYNFKGGAGGACINNKQDSHKTGISRVEEQSPKAKLEDDLSEDENKDLMKATPTRQSTRTSGKAFKFVEVSSGDNSIQSDADVSEGEDKNDVAVDSSAGNHTGVKAGNLFSVFDIDDKEGVKASVAQSKRSSLSSTKKIKSNEDSCKNQGPLVQATISTLFKKVEEKTVRRSPRKPPSPKASGQKAQNTNLKRKIIQDEVPKKKPKLISEKSAGCIEILHSNSFIPRTLKLDFPKYDGQDDPIQWLCKAEKYFMLHEIMETDKVTLASFYLHGDAELWFQMIEQELLYVTWEDFKTGIMTRFGPNHFDDHFGELIKLRQTGTVMDYQGKFERLLARIGVLAPDKKVSCFVAGLKDSIRTDVQANRPTTLTMAIGLAKLYEARDQVQRRPTTQHLQSTVGMTPTTPAIKKMTPEELSERRKKGLCFHCHDKFSPGHSCKRLFMIEASWEDEDDGDIEVQIEDQTEAANLEISLHAIVGDGAPNTIKVEGKVLSQPIIVLVDTGSTHNFISTHTIQRVGSLPISNQKSSSVMVASGDEVDSPGICKKVPIELQNISFPADLFVLPFQGCDIILGAQWLMTLGCIEMDSRMH